VARGCSGKQRSERFGAALGGLAGVFQKADLFFLIRLQKSIEASTFVLSFFKRDVLNTFLLSSVG
jgi:hypothetical protein